MAQVVIDHCMQIHGAAGLTADYPMAEAFNYARWCRQADGRDQVHMMALGRDVVSRGDLPGVVDGVPHGAGSRSAKRTR